MVVKAELSSPDKGGQKIALGDQGEVRLANEPLHDRGRGDRRWRVV